MKLINKTKYDTAALRKLVQAVYDRLRKTEGAHNAWDEMVVTVRTGRYSGHAAIGHKVTYHRPSTGTSEVVTYHGTRMTLRLPVPTRRRSTVPGEQAKTGTVARLIEHELRHSYGERHKRGHKCMSGSWNDEKAAYVEECNREWADFFTGGVIPLRAAKPPVERDLASERYARVVERERVWTSKLKRAQTALRKLRQQRRYYETRMAARGAKKVDAE